MQKPGAVSRTALTAAAARAAHLLFDSEPLIFRDPLAQLMLGAQADDLLAFHREHGSHPILAAARTMVTTRSRFTESRLATAIARGTRQYVILGAGLDSYVYRSEQHHLQVYEVDHPATQAWKRARLEESSTAVPSTAAFVAVDFEKDSLTDGLARAGFDFAGPAFVSWLGVNMYLTGDAISDALRVVASFAPGSELVLDHMLPPDDCDEAGRLYADAVGANAAEGGEPWLSRFSTAEVADLCAANGLHAVEQVGTRDAVEPRLWQRADALTPIRLAALTRAVVPAS